jgi:hypothetical protein
MLGKFRAVLENKSSSAVMLLTCSLVFIFVLPTFEFQTNIFSLVIFSLILFLSAYSISRRVILFGVIAILIELSTNTTDLLYLHYFAELATNVFILFVVGSMIKRLLREKDVTIFTLIDAVNGYLLLGILFISLVAFCDLYLPAAYNAPGETDMELVYYTLITLTTAGYGDITPKAPLTQSLAMFMAVTGQFYVAVIVAILVGKYSANGNP